MYGSEIPPGLFTFEEGITGAGFISRLVSKGHGYIAAIKGNAGNVFEEIKSANWSKSPLRATLTDKKAHGRQETRTIEILRTTEFPSGRLSKYSKCGSVLRVTREFTDGEKTTTDTRYFIASTSLGTLTRLEFLERVRAHWIRENGLHWCKDAVLGEDDLPKQSHKSSRQACFAVILESGAAPMVHHVVCPRRNSTCCNKPCRRQSTSKSLQQAFRFRLWNTMHQ